MAPGDEARPSTTRRNLPRWRATLRRGRLHARRRPSPVNHPELRPFPTYIGITRLALPGPRSPVSNIRSSRVRFSPRAHPSPALRLLLKPTKMKSGTMITIWRGAGGRKLRPMHTFVARRCAHGRAMPRAARGAFGAIAGAFFGGPLLPPGPGRLRASRQGAVRRSPSTPSGRSGRSGRRDSNPQRPTWKAGALAIELRPRGQCRWPIVNRRWERVDSNHRRPEADRFTVCSL